jgi:hypothetical protein
MTVKIFSSNEADATSAARKIAAEIGDLKPTLILWFTSPRLDPKVIARELSGAFPDATSLGCTSSGELVSGKMLKGSLVVMAADETTILKAHAVLIDDVRSEESTKFSLAQLSALAGVPSPSQLDAKQFLGLVLQDGMSGAEELVMATLSGATNVPFVGGSAGDDLAFQSTQVFVGESGGSGSGALALVSPKDSYQILKTQSFEVKDTVLEVTECEPETRTVVSFNGQPAAAAYAEAIGVPIERLAQAFGRNPLGLVVDDGEPFVRSPREIQGTKVAFYCQVLPGMKMHLLQATDIVAKTKRDLKEALASFGDCTAIINFHCILRTLELEDVGACEAYGSLFDKVPTVGLSTYGESYVGHINQTSTMILLR